MQARQIARELALLSMSQLSASEERLSEQQLPDLVAAAVRTLTGEVQDALENAAAELKRGSDRLGNSEIQNTSVKSARGMVTEAIELTLSAINRLGAAVELPEFIYTARQEEVKAYAIEIIGTVNKQKSDIDNLITEAMVDWQINRLPRIDRDILRIAVTEIYYLDLPESVAINQAVELAKRYSGEEGHRFVNGVLRRVSDNLKGVEVKGKG